MKNEYPSSSAMFLVASDQKVARSKIFSEFNFCGVYNMQKCHIPIFLFHTSRTTFLRCPRAWGDKE
jgi:hypothetical protein